MKRQSIDFYQRVVLERKLVDRIGFEPMTFGLGIFYSMRLFEGKMFFINGLGMLSSEK